jgi:hypothetical protein
MDSMFLSKMMGSRIENIKMLWDTGAQMIIISEEILSHSFREFLSISCSIQLMTCIVPQTSFGADISIAFTGISRNYLSLLGKIESPHMQKLFSKWKLISSVIETFYY